MLSYVLLLAAGVALAAGQLVVSPYADASHMGVAGAAAQRSSVVSASVLAAGARALRYNGQTIYLYNGAYYFADGRPCPAGYPPVRAGEHPLTDSDATQHDAAYHGSVAGFPYNYGGYAYGAYPAATAWANNYAPYAYNAFYGPARSATFYNNNPFLRFPFKKQ